MRAIIIAALIIATPVLGDTVTDVANPNALPCYILGAPMWMHFAYDGGIEDWNASFGFDTKGISPIVNLGNNAFFVLSRGAGPFESRANGKKKFYRPWELLEAPRGKVVLPKNDKFGGAAQYMAEVNEPFDYMVDLRRYFEIDEPGVYTLVWGCKPKYLNEVVFEVIP